MVDIKRLLDDLRADPEGEGDLTEYDTDTLVIALNRRLIRRHACTRPFKNIRITAWGRECAHKMTS